MCSLLWEIRRRRRIRNVSFLGTRLYSVLAEHRHPLQQIKHTLSQIIDHIEHSHSSSRIEYSTYKEALILSGESKSLSQGKFVHSKIVSDGLESDRTLSACTIFMYAKCGDIESAQRVFDRIKEHNQACWNGLLVAYVLNGHPNRAVILFRHMQLQGTKPNRATFATVFNACTRTGSISDARSIYSTISSLGYTCNENLHNALLNTYVKLGSIHETRTLFNEIPDKNIVSWTLMVSAFAKKGHLDEALVTMYHMYLEGMSPNRITFIAILEACTIETGRKIHARVAEAGLDENITVGTSLLDMYTKCGSLAEARAVFDKMDVSDVISWTAMISAYVKYDEARESLKLLKLMQLEGIPPNCVTILVCVNACAKLTDLKEGVGLHEKIVESGFDEIHLNVGNALVDMYGSCGSLGTATAVFRKMPVRDTGTWNSLIMSYSQDGDPCVSLGLFLEMLLEGNPPDDITFVGVLYACTSAGMLDKGHQYYGSITSDFGLTIRFQHCGCLLDLFSRVGWLEYAQEYVAVMPFYPDDKKWMTMLASCRIHGDVHRAKWAAQHSLQLTPHDSAAYVVLCNTYMEEESAELDEVL